MMSDSTLREWISGAEYVRQITELEEDRLARWRFSISFSKLPRQAARYSTSVPGRESMRVFSPNTALR